MTAKLKFENYLSTYQRVLKWAIGPSALLPMLSGLSGLTPPYPPGVIMLTAIYTLIATVITYSLFRTVKKRHLNYALLVLTLVASLLLVQYLDLRRFIYEIPDDANQTTIILGCGWSEAVISQADDYAISLDDDCPGNFTQVLADAENVARAIYTSRSIDRNTLLLPITWLGFFTGFAAILGAFLAYTTFQESRSAGRKHPSQD